jgi:hypothetical protein
MERVLESSPISDCLAVSAWKAEFTGERFSSSLRATAELDAFTSYLDSIALQADAAPSEAALDHATGLLVAS